MLAGPIPYILRPSAGSPEGALILNHGRGADEHNLTGLIDELDPERRLLGITPGGPLRGIPPGGRHWYVVPRVGYPDPPTFHSAYQGLGELLDGLLAEHGIDWDRTVVGGFSMGTVMSYSLALGPGRPAPAAVLAMSGFVPIVEGWEPELGGRDRTQFLIHHGRRDPIMEVGFAQRAVELLRAGGIEPDYHETDAGHWIPPELVPVMRDTVTAAIGPA